MSDVPKNRPAKQDAPPPRPDEDPINLEEIGMHIRELHNRALSLYIADPTSMPSLRRILNTARSSIQGTVPDKDGIRCPGGMVPCLPGCCAPTIDVPGDCLDS